MCPEDSQELHSLQDSCSLCVLRLPREWESPRLLETVSLKTVSKTVFLETAACLPVLQTAKRLADFLESLGDFETVHLGQVTETGVKNKVVESENHFTL